MKENWKKVTAGAVALVLVFSVGFFCGKSRATDDLERRLEVFLQVLSLVKNQYVEKDVDNQQLVYGAIRGLLDSLDDPYSRFLEPKAFSEMRVRMRGNYNGIGIYIGMRDKHLTVISPIQGTPAQKAGLRARDWIQAIDDRSTKDMALEEAVSLIRGKTGTKVKLTIMRAGFKTPRDFSIARERIIIKSVETKTLENNIAYIKLNSFEKQGSANEFKDALNDAKRKRSRGLVVDLRGNGGGLLDNAIQIGSMFIRSGAIVQTVDREGKREIRYSTGGVVWTGPLVLLVDESSASASEILAGALQDNKAAKIVGTKSFGKASVQSVRVLQDDSAILLTIAKYLTPDGHDITKKGIIPDFIMELPTLEAEVKALEEADRDIQLEKAIEVVKSFL